MIRILILTLASIQSLQAVWLTYEEAVLNSPFKTASIGWTIPFPDEDAVLIRGKGADWKKWFKVVTGEYEGWINNEYLWGD